MADLSALPIDGHWVLPQLVLQGAQLLVRVAITTTHDEPLKGDAIAVTLMLGAQSAPLVKGPDPAQPLPTAATSEITASADFVFANPQALAPTALVVTLAGQSASFDLGEIVPVAGPAPPAPAVALTVSLLRPDDLLNLEIDTVNLRLDAADPAQPALVAADAALPALLVVRFPPQTIVEQAFYEAGGKPQKVEPPEVERKDATPSTTEVPLAPGKVTARIGEPSRLVFRLPAGAAVPFSTAGLLDWSGWELVVPPVADVLPGAEPPLDALSIRKPAPLETTLQLPYRLHLAPPHGVTWAHARELVVHGGRAELWHTRLALRAADGTPLGIDAQHTAPLRAVWSPDYQAAGMPAPGDLDPLGARAALSRYDRHQIVVLTSAFRGYAAGSFMRYEPQPIQASQLMLSPLGGWLRSSGKWEPPWSILPTFTRMTGTRPPLVAYQERVHPAPVRAAALVRPDALFGLPRYELDQQLDLSQWTHVAAQGRDHYVRVVYEGRLKEFGHRASLVKVTERRFEPAPGTGAPVAYLRQYMYIVVREPEIDYTRAGLKNDGRDMPLHRVRLTTLVTPKIDPPYPEPGKAPPLPAITDRSFWVMVDKHDFLFHGVAEDVAGNRIDFAKPMIFVPNSETKLAAIDLAISLQRTRMQAEVPGQKLAFAPPSAGNENTSFATVVLSFENEGATRDTFFKPRLRKADVRIPAVEQLSGKSEKVTIRLSEAYRTKGFGDPGNAAGLFADIVTEDVAGVLASGALTVGFSAQQAGGFARPKLDTRWLTRAAGPLGGTIDQALANVFNPEDVFKKGVATLFGVLDLADLLPTGPATERAPKMQVRHEGGVVITQLDWESPVPDPLSLGIVEFIPDHEETKLAVRVEFRKKPGAPEQDASSVRGSLNKFALLFLEVVQVNFARFSFDAASGRKTDVKVQLDDAAPVEFMGDLEFVTALRDLIPPGTFGDGVSIDLIDNPLGVHAGVGISLPPASVGIFALKNIAFSAGLTLPFLDGKPFLDFGFARRDEPFLLAVALFGGGGFFHIELDAEGIRMLEAAFEFGAVAALSVGVASGEVHIMAGIYFKLEKKEVPGHTTKELVAVLSGYLRCGGKMSVLGIVTVSIEFYLCFTYSDGEACGSATLTVAVKIACFSKSIKLELERCFGSKSGDPSFEQLMDTPQVWRDYAGAFA